MSDFITPEEVRAMDRRQVLIVVIVFMSMFIAFSALYTIITANVITTTIEEIAESSKGARRHYALTIDSIRLNQDTIKRNQKLILEALQ